MKFSYNYFSPLNFFVRSTEDEVLKSWNSLTPSKKAKTPKHIIKKRASSACKPRTPNSRTINSTKPYQDQSFEIPTNDFLQKTFNNLFDKTLETETFDQNKGGTFEDSHQNLLNSSKHQPLENFFRSRRNSIRDEIKFIFDEDKTKSSCMVQTEETNLAEKPQPSLLKLIHKSRTTSKVKVPRDLSTSLSIKKYDTPSRVVRSTRFFICRESSSTKPNEKIEENHRKEQLVTPTRIKIKIEKKILLEKTCKTLNLADYSSLFTLKTPSKPAEHRKKSSNSKTGSKNFPSSCKSYKPTRFHFGI